MAWPRDVKGNLRLHCQCAPPTITFILNIKNSTAEWQQQQLISAEQAAAILRYEEAKPKKNWIMISVMFLGTFVLAVGIVSLIAANWDFFGGQVKLTVDGILLICLAAVLVSLQANEKPILYEAVLSFFILLVLASIGLVSQVYHRNGELYQALSLWLVLIAPLIFLSRTSFVPHLFCVAFIVTGFCLTKYFDRHAFSIFNNSHVGEAYIAALAMLLPLFFSTLAQLTGFCNSLQKHSRVFRQWSILLFVLTIPVADAIVGDGSYYDTFVFPNTNVQNALLLGGLIFLALSLPYSWPWRQRLVFGAIAVLHLTAHQLPRTDLKSEIVGAIFTLLSWSMVALLCVMRTHKRLFNGMLILIGIRFLIVYFQVIGSLAMTGVGLIVSGLLIIGVSFIGIKYQKQLYRWAEGKAQ